VTLGVRILLSRIRLTLARGMLNAGRRIILEEERRWGLAPPPPSGRVPIVPRR
jgi:hypothetical protein